MTFKRHKIFASGVHKSDVAPVWSPDNVREVFDATIAHSPVKIPYTYRHPVNSLPVLGYADRDSLEVFEEDGRTYLTAQPLDFAKEWLAGLKKTGFNKVSIGLGKLGEIVHIGMTDSPAVSGLGLAFEASATVPAVYAQEVEFESADLGDPVAGFEVSWKWQLQGWMQDVASLFQRMRDREIEANGVDAADQVLPAYIMDYLKTPLPPDEKSENEETTINPQFEELMDLDKQELERLRVENAALLQRQSEAEALRVQGEITGFCAQFPAVVTPKIKDSIVAILTDLHGAQPRQFEVDGAQVTKTSFEILKELIAGAKPQLVFEQVATKDKALNKKSKSLDPVKDALTAQFEALRGNTCD